MLVKPVVTLATETKSYRASEKIKRERERERGGCDKYYSDAKKSHK